jgi:hypothetical protein
VSAPSHVGVLEAFPFYPRIFSIRICKCAIPIFQWNVWTPATTATAVRRPTMGNARRQSYVLPSSHVVIFRRFTPCIYSITVSCSEYLCQDTLVCVTKPMDCPCPNVEDIKCVVPDVQDAGSGTRLCIRGGTDCGQLEKLVKKFSQ